MELAAAAFARDPGPGTRSSSSTTVRRTTPGRVLQRARRRATPFCASSAIAASAGSPTRLRTGYLHARGRVLVFYPADLQFKPEDIPRLVAPILAGTKSDMVTGFKEGKYEKAFVSGIYNRLEPNAVRRPRAGSQLREGLSPRDHGRAARSPRLASLHDRDRRRAGIHRHGDPGARCIRATRASRSSRRGIASRSACSTCSPSGSSCGSARSRCSSSA